MTPVNIQVEVEQWQSETIIAYIGVTDKDNPKNDARFAIAVKKDNGKAELTIISPKKGGDIRKSVKQSFKPKEPRNAKAEN